MTRTQLGRMTVQELRELGGRHGVRIGSRMKKAEIVKALARALQKNAAAPSQPGPASSASSLGPETAMLIEESKYYTGPAPAPPLPPAPLDESSRLHAKLPEDYGDDKIAVMARDPYWAFTYWEVTGKRLEMERRGLGDEGEASSLSLRVYDVTGIDFDGANAQGHFDIGVYERVGNWYIDVARPGRSCIVDLGLKTPGGRFVTLARSNRVSMPRDGISDVLDEDWGIAESDFNRIFALSGGYGIGHSSADVGLLAGGKLPFGLASPGMGSLALMSPMVKRQRGFWFVLNTELIVYGATEPDAQVTVQGRPITLRPDGTFTLRFALPDGRQVIPVSATSGDRVETRWITPQVERRTS